MKRFVIILILCLLPMTVVNSQFRFGLIEAIREKSKVIENNVKVEKLGNISYNSIDYNSFMKNSHSVIANDMAGILEVTPIAYSQKVLPGDKGVGLAGDQWIKEGYEYIATNGAFIDVWVDNNNQPYIVTYKLTRGGPSSSDWSYGQELANSKIRSIVGQTGIILDGSEEFYSHNSAGAGMGHWYDIRIQQKYKGTSVKYPYIISEVEGSTGEVNFLSICRWYSNLSSIDDILSDIQLMDIANRYYESSSEVISMNTNLHLSRYYIAKNKLCIKIGSAVIDQWGSTLDLYIDVQNGDVVDVERLWVD